MIREDAPRAIQLVSDPPGASVFLAGDELGVTPLEVVPADSFESGFSGLSYRYKGKLVFKKPGCEPYTKQLNDAVAKQDIHVSLMCDPDYRAPAPAPAVGGDSVGASGDYETRLKRIESLHDQGLISDDEYETLRKRILDHL